MALKTRVDRLEKIGISGAGSCLTEIMAAAVGLNEQLFKMEDQALLQLANNKSEPQSTRVLGIRRLLTRNIDAQTRLNLLKAEQAITQAELKEAQEREITAASRKGRLLQERMKLASERVATYWLDEINKEIAVMQG